MILGLITHIWVLVLDGGTAAELTFEGSGAECYVQQGLNKDYTWDKNSHKHTIWLQTVTATVLKLPLAHNPNSRVQHVKHRRLCG